METQSSRSPLQRHPKCSALYASRLRHNSEATKPTEVLTASVAYLANVTVEVTTKALLTRDSSTFALTVHDNKSSSTWRHLRSYSECRAFQSQVLKVLSRGHLCFAECPWLYAYVQRALPVERTGHHLFRVAGHSPKPRVVENQRQALARLFATLQRVLLNPLNQKCTVLMQQVAPEVITFITNRSGVNADIALNSPTSNGPLAKTFSESFMFEIEEDTKSDDESFGQTSTLTTASLDDLDESIPAEEDATIAALDKVVAGQRVCCAMCALHKRRSDEQVFACWRAESMSSRFMRLRAGAGAERISLVAKRQLPTHSNESQVKNGWQSPAPSQQAMSPLEPLAVLGDRVSEDMVIVTTEHEGTPTEPFPGSPCTPPVPGTPRDSVASASSVCQIDLEMLDDWCLSNAIPSPEQQQTAPPAKSSGLERIRRMPRRSLLVLNSLRSKFTTRKHCVI
ncbi:uncharacterized protein PITG_15546 [Phytophthora infestans T30-4]|uniref:PX domain-containing protein n=2 Tax=Phytophthora infestans TaxID=4787 RepID=D0NT17_PHYIT|nr:uncharacterized protein PITG_15546 [Phytophthora infestans T30-4]EEY64773.1 conserved hypothetical protein [Phytophthora infestans T30-4]|eukprot:XP_002897700.1 conserved hypothetical protein [Phytophthora infestans T30-4]